MYNQMNQGMMNPMVGGMQYNQQQAKMTQPLTKEEMAKLQKQGNAKLVVDELDVLRAKCTHKNNGQLMLMQNGNGTHTCSICGETFNLVDVDPAEVEMLTQRMVDVLQSIKTYYLDMPANYASEFFVMIPLLKNTPELYKIALNQFSKYESGSVVNQNNGMYGFNLFNTLTNPAMGMGMMQQPMMNPMQQPMMNSMNPMQQPMMGNGMMPGMPVQYDAYGNPVQGMMPMGGANPFTGQGVMNNTAQEINNQVQTQNQIQGTPNNNEAGQVTTTKTFNV